MTTVLQKLIFSKGDGRCWYCGRVVVLNGDGNAPEYMTVDHLIPRSRGGSDEIDNLAPACGPCNCSKGRMTVEEFRQHRARKNLFAEHNIPEFSKPQMDWLNSQGFRFPHFDPLKIKFYFESGCVADVLVWPQGDAA